MKFLILFLILTSLLFSSANKPDFTKKEQEWIKQNPVVKAGSGDDWAPFNFVDRYGMFQGITEDYLSLVEKKSGLKIDRKVGKWSDIFDSFKKGSIDFLPTALYKKERKKYGNYIKPHIKLRDFIYVRSDNNSINSFKDLNGKTLVRKRGYAVLDPYLKHLKNVNVIEVDSTLDMINAVYNKEADAFLEGQANINYVLKENMIGGFKSIAQGISSPTTAHFLVKKDSPELYSILQKTLNSISKEEKQQIFDKWISFESNIETDKIILTEEEKTWLQDHKVIRVGVEKDWAPYDFIDEDGNYQGIAKDYLEYISKELGIKFEYYPDEWSNLLRKIEDKKVDLLPALYYAKSRSKYIEFSQSYMKIPEYLYTHKETSKVDGLSALNGKKISVVSGYTIVEWLKKNHPKIKLIEKPNILESLQSVQTKEAFGFIGDNGSSNHIIQNYMLHSLKINNIVNERTPTNVYMGVRKDWGILAKIITKTIDSISYSKQRKIIAKWIDSDLSTQKSSINLSLSKKEKQWLKTKPVIRYSEVNWKPLSIIEQNTMNGIMGEYLEYISILTGIEFKYVPSSSWKDVIDKFASGEIDVIPGVGGSNEELALGDVSTPYAKYPMVIVTNENVSYIKSLKDVIQKRFSVPKYYTSYNFLKNNYPSAKIIATDSIEESMKMVASGDADIFIGHIAPAIYNISKLGLKNLKIAGEADFEFTHHYLVSDKYPHLLPILDKVFSTITQQKRDEIYSNWVHVEIGKDFDYSILIKVGIGILILFIILSFYNRKISNQKEFVQTLLDSQEQIIITKNQDQLVSVNKAFLDFFECNDLEEFENKYRNKYILKTFTNLAEEQYIESTMSSIGWSEHIVNNNHLTNKAQINKGDKVHTFSVTATILPGKQRLISVVFTDITDLEETKKEIAHIYKQTRDSIEYASLIQHSLIPEKEKLEKYFKDHFAIWEPKDVVGGDIYLFEELRYEDESLLMLIDSTGHGVPGAFVTMLVKAIERQIVARINYSSEVVSPANLLSVFNKSMKHLLKQESVDSVSNAGFDGAIIYYNKKDSYIRFAGAEIPLFYIDKHGEFQTIKGCRHSIGYKKSDSNFEFKDHYIKVEKGMEFILTTDGSIDQNGGKKSFPFGKKRFKKVFLDTKNESCEIQKVSLLEAIKDYQGDEERNDDITVIGFKV